LAFVIWPRAFFICCRLTKNPRQFPAGGFD
jgi:hypothetical protein